LNDPFTPRPFGLPEWWFLDACAARFPTVYATARRSIGIKPVSIEATLCFILHDTQLIKVFCYAVKNDHVGISLAARLYLLGKWVERSNRVFTQLCWMPFETNFAWQINRQPSGEMRVIAMIIV
jgi:hypothetical protein